MNIDRVRVKGLFDDFDHDLAFRANEKIMLLTGPNGHGKTTTLNLINVLFNQSPQHLVDLPFREVEVFFDDGSRLHVENFSSNCDNDAELYPLRVTINQVNASETFQPAKIHMNPKDLRNPVSSMDDTVPVLRRVDPYQRINLDTGSTLDPTEVLSDFSPCFPDEVAPGFVSHSHWLQEKNGFVSVRFIDTDRLTRMSQRERFHSGIKRTRTVSHYSEALSRQIQHSIASYGELSHSLDRSFPTRLITQSGHSNHSTATLHKELKQIEQRRSQFKEVGFLAEDHQRLAIPDVSDLDESHRGILEIYTQDAKAKLAVFDELYEKVRTLQQIVNARFSHKRITVSQKGLQVEKEDGSILDIEKTILGRTT